MKKIFIIAALAIAGTAQASVTVTQANVFDVNGKAPASVVFDAGSDKIAVSSCALHVDGVDTSKNDYTIGFYDVKDVSKVQSSGKAVKMQVKGQNMSVDFATPELQKQFIQSLATQTNYCS